MIDRYANYKLRVENGKLHIEIVIDETQVDVQQSGSGKTLVLATSEGISTSQS